MDQFMVFLQAVADAIKKGFEWLMSILKAEK